MAENHDIFFLSEDYYENIFGTELAYKTFMPRILGTTINETYMGHDWVFSCLP